MHKVCMQSKEITIVISKSKTVFQVDETRRYQVGDFWYVENVDSE